MPWKRAYPAAHQRPMDIIAHHLTHSIYLGIFLSDCKLDGLGVNSLQGALILLNYRCLDLLASPRRHLFSPLLRV